MRVLACASMSIRSIFEPGYSSKPMPVFPIRLFGDPVLRTPAEPVTEFGESIERIIEDMLETMYAAPGVGLAAPQIGVSKQLFVYDVGEGPGHLINPELVETADEWLFDEGCLSIPERFWPIERPGYARVRGVDRHNQAQEVEGDELMGRLIQHEIDHLGGTLLLSRLDKKLRKEALRELREEALGIRLAE